MRTLVVASILAGIAAVTVVSACDAPPANSKQTLKVLSATRVFASPPPAATAIGSAQDAGSTSTVAARDPGVENVYATAQSVGDVLSYYERTYPQYRFTQTFGSVPQGKQLFGRDGWAYILINITRPARPGSCAGIPYQTKPSAPNGHHLRRGNRLRPTADTGCQ